MQRMSTQSGVDEQRRPRPGTGLEADPDIEAVRIRNYDHWQGHSVRVTVAPPDGEVSLVERHYLGPGETGELTGPLAPGEYDVRVWIDGVERAGRTCRLDATSAGTAVVELGNGVVSLTG